MPYPSTDEAVWRQSGRCHVGGKDSQTFRIPASTGCRERDCGSLEPSSLILKVKENLLHENPSSQMGSPSVDFRVGSWITFWSCCSPAVWQSGCYFPSLSLCFSICKMRNMDPESEGVVRIDDSSDWNNSQDHYCCQHSVSDVSEFRSTVGWIHSLEPVDMKGQLYFAIVCKGLNHLQIPKSPDTKGWPHACAYMHVCMCTYAHTNIHILHPNLA